MKNLRLERILSNSALISTEALLREAKEIADRDPISPDDKKRLKLLVYGSMHLLDLAVDLDRPVDLSKNPN
jgi:hypothetical protein